LSHELQICARAAEQDLKAASAIAERLIDQLSTRVLEEIEGEQDRG
jgi:hypothetical protein